MACLFCCHVTLVYINSLWLGLCKDLEKYRAGLEATVVSGPLTPSIGLIAFCSLGRATSFQTVLATLLTSQSIL